MDIGYRFKRINDLLHKRTNNMLESYGITFSQHHVLLYINCKDDKTCKLKTIEKYFNVSQATMAGIVKRLEEKELLKSFYKEDDKRIKYVSLTKKGEELCLVTDEYVRDLEGKMLSLYTEEEMNNFISYLDRLYKYLEVELDDKGTK